MGDEPWRRTVKLMRTYGPLRRRTATKQSKELAASLTAEACAAAAANPDHSDAGRALAEQAAGGRRFDLRAPGWIDARDLTGGDALFFGAERRIRRVLVGLFAVSTALCVGLLPALFVTGAPVLAWIWALAACLVPITLIAATAAIGLRRRPARLLLLRKFNDRRLSAMLRDLVFRELVPFGQIVTLSDRHIRRKVYGLTDAAVDFGGELFGGVLIPVFLRWFFVEPTRVVLRLFNRARFGPAFVGSARDFRNLAYRLSDRVGLNWEVTFTSNKAFMIRTTDRWWRQVVALLMNSADVVIVDVSVVTSGTRWELDELKARSMPAQAVFIVAEGYEKAARQALEQSGLNHDAPLHGYGPGGRIADQAALRAAIMTALGASLRRRAGLSGELAQGGLAAADARAAAC